MLFSSQPVAEHIEVPLADGGAWEELVESAQARTRPTHHLTGDNSPVYVLSVSESRDPLVQQAQLAEICELSEAQGATILGREVRMLSGAHPGTLLGSGTCREVGERARACGATMLVMDAELSPSQMRNLEDLIGLPVADREGIILNVFRQNARTRHARVQVEIARLEYLRPRIRGVGLDMDQQMGGVTGSRGPGETASELMARKLDGRLLDLKKLEKKFQSDGLQQRRQRAQNCQRVALVGYTNAGKTSLMNALTGENLSARQRPFETLDTTSRSLSRHGQSVLLSDTVGFIRRLPQRLLASFESTLVEVREADLLMLVVDVSDYEWRQHLTTTQQLLERLGADNSPRLYVFNKADRLERAPDPEELAEMAQGHPYRLLSSLDPVAVEGLRHLIVDLGRQEWVRTSLFVPYSAPELLGRVYRSCRVLYSRSRPTGLRLTVQASSQEMKQLKEASQCLHR